MMTDSCYLINFVIFAGLYAFARKFDMMTQSDSEPQCT